MRPNNPAAALIRVSGDGRGLIFHRQSICRIQESARHTERKPDIRPGRNETPRRLGSSSDDPHRDCLAWAWHHVQSRSGGVPRLLRADSGLTRTSREC